MANFFAILNKPQVTPNNIVLELPDELSKSDTDFVLNETDMLDIIPEARKETLKNASILGKFATPEDVAASALWLALDSPAYINGICVDINNGSFMR